MILETLAVGYFILFFLFYRTRRWSDFDLVDKLFLSWFLGLSALALVPGIQGQEILFAALLIVCRLAWELAKKLFSWVCCPGVSMLVAKVKNFFLVELVLSLWR